MAYSSKYKSILSERKSVKNVANETEDMPLEQENVRKQRKYKYSFFGLVLILIIFTLAVIGSKVDKAEKNKKVFSQGEERINAILDDIQNNGEMTLYEKRGKLEEVKDILQELEGKNVDINEITLIKNQIIEFESQILGERKKDTKLFLDLNLLTSEFNGSKFTLSENYAYVCDFEKRIAVMIETGSKRSQIVMGPDQIDGLISFAAYLESIYVLKRDGIYKLEDNEFIKIKEGEFSDKQYLFAYAGNLYILDSLRNQIFRYSVYQDGFADAKEWLVEASVSDFSEVTDFFIDGAVWLVKNYQSVEKYTYGNRQGFKLDSDFVGIARIESMFSDEESELLYLLDDVNGKIFVFDKNTGDYVCQYISEEIKNCQDFVVLSESKRALILKEGKIFSIDL